MLIFQIIALFGITAASSHLMARQEPTPPPLSGTDPCNQNCTSTYNLIVQCALSPDPSCGCTQLRTDSASCSQCLQSTNSTVAGFLTYDYIRSSIAGCSCEIPACATIGSVVRFCLYVDPKSTACSCPGFLATGSQCSQCLRGVDPYVADLYDIQYIPGCQLFQSYISNLTGVSPTNCPVAPSSSSSPASASGSKPSSVPASGSAVSSPSGVVTFTSASDRLHFSTRLALIALAVIVFA
jgi:hypothetical protein